MTPPLAVMAGGDHISRMAAAGRAFDELKAAGNRGDFGTYHPIRHEEQ